ncbi:MAG: rhodanese-like domain-containing protein [Deltaproteobacteria bacterium]|nr:rhodanese-like domain-containing protein [Deltaproteobacteria bacterium]
MIELRQLFTPVEAIDAEEAQKYLAEHREGAYTLLDVRQPWEYEKDHIPGARLIPLGQLKDSINELDKDKPTLVYCAVGGRSRVAAQLMSGLGFKEVYNLAGGIKAYRGAKAAGPYELSLDLVRGDETPSEMLALAFGMEKALQKFYETMAGKSQDQELTNLLTRLGHIEAAHQRQVFERYQALNPDTKDMAALEAEVNADVMEGGYNVKEFLTKNEPYMQTAPQILEVAMMVETQALDLYLRFASKSREEETRETLFAIAEEEKAHLAALGRLLDEKRS